MDIVLKILGGSLGLLVPGLFMLAINKGIDRSPLDESKKVSSKTALSILVILWTVVVFGASLAGVISYHEGDQIPRVLIALFIPVLAGLLALANRDFQTILDHTPLAALVGVQAFRFAGAAFLLVVYLGILPSSFSTGGYGDLMTAALATVAAVMLSEKMTAGAKVVFWGFTLAGLGDLLNVAFLIVAYYPIWYRGTPSSAPIADFALIMIPAIAAPFALLLHTYAIRAVVLGKSASQASPALRMP
jgi:hypothetical protein